jgi:hypothetical protein
MGANDDLLEQEAVRVADQVLAVGVDPAVRHMQSRIQRYKGPTTGQMDAVPGSVDRILASPGSPLDPALRQDMEWRFGHDFSRVRVYTDAKAAESARDVKAHAYTVGQSIVFGTGQFAPGDKRRAALAFA